MKWGYISVQKLESERSKSFVCPFHLKPGQSGVSLESPGLANIPQVPANRAEVGQNHGALKAVSATPSVLKCSGALFRPTSSKLKKNYCVYFTANQGHQELVYTPRDWKISPKFGEIEKTLVKITMRVRRSRLLFQS